MKKAIFVLFLILTFTPVIAAKVNATSVGEDYTNSQVTKKDYKAKILDVYKKDCADGQTGQMECSDVEVEFLNRGKKGEQVTIEVDTRSDLVAKAWDLKPGKKVVVTEYKYEDQSSYQITEMYRANTLLWLGVFYAGLVIAVAGKQGFGALIGLGISIAVIVEFIIPSTIDGNDPVLISIIGGFLILIPSLYLSHGFNYKTNIALLGTAIGLIITGLLAALVMKITDLTGFGTDQSLFMSQIDKNIDVTGILLASMIIGGIGLIDDVTVGQVSVIQEIYSGNKKIKFEKLYRKSMNVGKDHVASMVNTLFLAYAAASIPMVLILISQGVKFSEIVNIEEFAEEIVRTIVASSGILLSVPITTLLGTYFYLNKKKFEAYKDSFIQRIEQK